jgi:choline/glycine/proline betaine transport protein
MRRAGFTLVRRPALTAQANSETKFRDLTGFSADQIASDGLIQLERWRLAGGLVLRTF